ncbi:TspO protein [Candidatus Cerribacteria bacterium 'Amazon FNV 2010 28 9']|uniref:TspO protein n=1 Tax=Candidatus Cerribacteria bacterium 'Amazon FNV 2010 28 9' TaxID=2081795 RepID=A0A317JNY2_9BACT|nr:MAG: TspO protein [Candidatus Cerribacteria bacterium 'Amazon FNV 2010 28 9']
MRHTRFHFWLHCLLAVGMCEGVGFASSFFTFSSIRTWYSTLHTPFFTPPSMVFAPVWTTLYALMGISLALAWKKKKNISFRWFWIQLCLNALWSLIFFAARNPLLAMGILVVLWGSIVMTMRSFHSVRIASVLLLPYLIWVSFAGILNLSIVLLNR